MVNDHIQLKRAANVGNRTDTTIDSQSWDSGLRAVRRDSPQLCRCASLVEMVIAHLFI